MWANEGGREALPGNPGDQERGPSPGGRPDEVVLWVISDLRWLTTVFSGERVPCLNLAKNGKRGFLLDCLSL